MRTGETAVTAVSQKVVALLMRLGVARCALDPGHGLSNACLGGLWLEIPRVRRPVI